MAIPLITGEQTEKESELLDKRYRQVIEALQKSAPEGAIIPEKIQAAREQERALRESEGALAPVGLLDPIDFVPDMMGLGIPAAALGSMAIKKGVQKALPSKAGFTSKLEDVIRQKMGGKATAQEIEAMVKQSGVKQEELEDINFSDWLRNTEAMLKEEQASKLLPKEATFDSENILEAINTNVPEPKLRKGQVLGYVQSRRPELKVTRLPNVEHEETISFLENKMMEASRLADQKYLELVSKIESSLMHDSGFDRDKIKAKLAEAKFKAESGKSLKYNTDLNQLILNSKLPQEEIINDFEQFLKTENESYFAQKEFSNFVQKHNLKPKYEGHSLLEKGIGKNYREYVYSYDPSEYPESGLPFGKKEKKYSSYHWEQKNPIYHIRAQDLVDKDGSKLLNVDELQSDLHQQGQKFGYAKKPMSDKDKEFIRDLLNKNLIGSDVQIAFLTERQLLSNALYLPDEDFKKVLPIMKESGLAVDLPFKKTWHEQGMRRMIMEALQTGKDGISWTSGSVQAKRAGQGLEDVRNLSYDPEQQILRGTIGEFESFAEEVPQQKLSSWIGSDAAKKVKEGIVKQKAAKDEWIARQKKQDDYAIEKYTNWIREQFAAGGSKDNEELVQSTVRSNLNTVQTTYGQESDKIREQMTQAGLTPMQMSDLITNRIIYYPVPEQIPIELSQKGQKGIEIGGMGMKNFYDEKVLNFMKDEAKRLGGTITKTAVIDESGVEYPLWKMTFGPKTKELLEQKGMPLYQVPAAIGLGELVRQYKQEQEQLNER